MSSVPSGKIQTVLGCIEPGDLGVTLTHEHLTIQYGLAHIPPTTELGKKLQDAVFTLENIGWIRQYPYNHRPNLVINEYDTLLQEMKYYKASGGSTVVDNTSIGIGRDCHFLKKLSQESEVNIIAGAGYYVGASHPSGMDRKTVEELVGEMKADVLQGCLGSDVKCGIIGEIGCSWPLMANEKKVLEATAIAQAELGCPVNIHPGRDHTAPFEIVRVLQEAGCDIHKTVMSHLDGRICDYGELAEFAKQGSYLEFDLFGIETAYYMFNEDYFFPNDGERINRIEHLVKEGFEDKIVISHDIHTNHRLMKYGGHGFSHIINNVLPMMRSKGFTEEVIDKIMRQNPKAWLTF